MLRAVQMKRLRPRLLDLVALTAALLALLGGMRASVKVPTLEELTRIEGVATDIDLRRDLLRFTIGSPSRRVSLRASTSAGWYELGAAVREGQELTLWVDPNASSSWISPAPDAWQIASGDLVLVPLRDVSRWIEREARLGRILCVVFALGACLLLVGQHVQGAPGRVDLDLAGRRKRSAKTQVAVAGLLALLGGSLVVHAWSLHTGVPDLGERAGAIVDREIRASDGRVNSLRLRIEGHEPTFVLFRKGTPGFEDLVERLALGAQVELLTDSDEALASRGLVSRFFLKPRVHGVRLGGEELLPARVTRQAIRDSVLPVFMGGILLTAFAIRAMRGALGEHPTSAT